MEWIKGYEGEYKIDMHGNVYSYKNRIVRKLKPNISSGYSTVVLCDYGIENYCYTHRLIAETYIPNPDNKRIVNHIDGNKLNNQIENLEWVTSSENARHAVATGLNDGSYNRKVVLQYGLDGKFIKEHESAVAACAILNKPRTALSSCLNGYADTAYGYIWKYK